MVNLNKLFLIIVLYNKKIDIGQYDELMNIKNIGQSISIAYVDNSTNWRIKSYNQSICDKRDVLYFDAHGNIGLSKAYNLAINAILNVRKDNEYNTWVMTLDQDTKVDKKYFINIIKSTNRKDTYPIKTGMVKFSGYIGSPMELSPFQKNIKNKNIWSNVECINSCLTLRLDLLKKVALYDERLFLDQVDRMILFKLRKIGFGKIEIIKGNIEQSFSGDSFTDNNSDIQRFKLYAKDTISYIFITKDRVFLMLWSIFKRWLHIKLHYLGIKISLNI